MKILYASEEEKVHVDEKGNLTITQANGTVANGHAKAEEEWSSIPDILRVS